MTRQNVSYPPISPCPNMFRTPQFYNNTAICFVPPITYAGTIKYVCPPPSRKNNHLPFVPSLPSIKEIELQHISCPLPQAPSPPSQICQWTLKKQLTSSIKFFNTGCHCIRPTQGRISWSEWFLTYKDFNELPVHPVQIGWHILFICSFLRG